MDSRITLTNNEIKDIIKVIRSLEDTGTTTKIYRQEGGFLDILRPLISAGLP